MAWHSSGTPKACSWKRGISVSTASGTYSSQWGEVQEERWLVVMMRWSTLGTLGLVTNSDRKGCHWFDNYKSEREEVTGNILLSGLQQAKPNWLSSTDAKEVNCYADTGAACQWIRCNHVIWDKPQIKAFYIKTMFVSALQLFPYDVNAAPPCKEADRWSISRETTAAIGWNLH